MSDDAIQLVDEISEMSDDAIQLVDEISEMSDDAIQLVDEISTSKEIDEWVVEIKTRYIPDNYNPIEPSQTSMDRHTEKWPSIFGNWQNWDDFRVSFLPENQMWQLVAWMTHWFDLNVCAYLQYMQQYEDRAWSYYHGVDKKIRAENSKQFIEYLLVNSCLLIFAMVLIISGENPIKSSLFEIFNSNNPPKGVTSRDIQNVVSHISGNRAAARCYMLTMNYQIPWFVVEAVHDFSNLRRILSDTPIHKFAVSCFQGLYPRMHPSKEDGGTIPTGGFKHLLHIIHWSRIPDGKYLRDQNISKTIGQFHIPSATELQLSQIVFEKDEGGSIDLSYCDKKIHLTPWHIMQYNTKLYESLLRFEQIVNSKIHKGIPFTAYVACMSCLLKTIADVRVLRAYGVIPSTGFDDNDVLRHVQELRTLLASNRWMSNELVIFQENVMAHYQRNAYRVYGEFKNRYCSKPWITISVIGGFLIFILTFIQTIYTAVGYYKQ